MYTYHLEPEKKLDAKRTQMETVEVFNDSGKSIGTYSWSRKPDTLQVDSMIHELIRDYELRIIWNRKGSMKAS